MRCSVCVQDGEPSTVFLVKRLPQSGPISPNAIFWDEQDRYHVHDSRPYIAQYRCDEGHRWRVETLEPCPSCDVGHGEPKVVFDVPNMPSEAAELRVER